MNKMVAIVFIILLTSAVTCGFVLYRDSELLIQNNEMRNQTDVLSRQNAELKNQNNYSLNQTNDLQEQNNELLTQNNSSQNQINTLQSQLDKFQNQTDELQGQIDELKQQNIELQNQTNHLTQISVIENSSLIVKVTNFTLLGFNPLVGIWIWSDAEITIQNLGTNDLDGLTLTIAHPENYPEGPPSNASIEINTIRAGEEQTFIVEEVSWVLGTGPHFMIKIKLGAIILDEYTA